MKPSQEFYKTVKKLNKELSGKAIKPTQDKELRKEVKKVVDGIHDMLSGFMNTPRQDVDLIIKVIEKLGYERKK